jgi:Rne/Rng family ribonuclease
MPGGLTVAATRHPGETRALLADAEGRAVEVRLFRGTPETAEGAVWRGRVIGTLAAARAVLVDVGGPLPALLPRADWPGRDEDLAEGRALLAMIDRPARAEKGPRLTGRIRLATPRLIFSPFRSGVSASHRLAAEDAKRLSAWAAGGATPGEGWVLRGAAASFSEAALVRDRELLRRRWAKVSSAAEGSPACLSPAPDPFAEWLADLAAEVDTVSVSGGALSLAARGILVERATVLASLADCFAEAGGEDALEAAASPLVALPGGGRLILESTRAFLSVDVDTGGDASPHAAIRANDEAVDELMRQLRLRNVGGQIVVDPVPESRRGPTDAQRKRLLERARRAIDPRLEYVGWSGLGHLELIRSRRGLSLHETVRGDTLGEGDAAAATEALSALRQAVATARTGAVHGFALSAAALGWLEGPGRGALAEAETMAGVRLSGRFRPDKGGMR